MIGYQLVISTASATEENREEASWYLGYGNPDVYITIVNSKINAQAWSNTPAIQLQTFNQHLWEQSSDNYIKIKDYNKDGYMDIGVMKGSGYGGSDACYAIYIYSPVAYSYRNRPSMTACN